MIFQVVSDIEKMRDGRFIKVVDHRTIIAAKDTVEAKALARRQVEAENLTDEKQQVRPSRQYAVPLMC